MCQVSRKQSFLQHTHPCKRQQNACVLRMMKAAPSAMPYRCNVDAEQRADFVSLAAAAGAPCHCLVLGLQQQLCLARATARQGHEGGVQGKTAARVVGQMAAQLKKAGKGKGQTRCGGTWQWR
jgi:hypothetical protein